MDAGPAGGRDMSHVLRCIAVVLALGTLAVTTAHAQTSGPTLAYSLVDRATVRVIAVRGVGSARVTSQSRRTRLVAVPEAGHGSGIIVSADGLVVTARHVVEDARLVAVWVPGESRAFQATVVYQDPTVDFAVLAVQGTFASFVPLAVTPRELRVREQVHAIGYPLDARREDPQSAQGIISGVLPDGTLQLDIALNPGNSGGPLIDANEQILGIVVARGSLDEGVQGIGVAVPMGPILAALTGEVPSRIADARARLTDTVHDADVAELVRLLVRVGAAELIEELLTEMDGHGQSELFVRLRALEESTHDADILALVAAYYWDAAAVVLERAGGMMRVAEMPAGTDRTLARDLLTRALRLVYRAAAADAELETRSPFVRRLVYYFEAPPDADESRPVEIAPSVAAGDAPPILVDATLVTPSSSGGMGSSTAATAPGEPSAEAPDLYHDHRLRLGGFLGLTSPPQSFGADGALLSFRFAWSPITGRIGSFAFDPIVGVATGVGYWDGALLHLTAEVGGMFRLGDRFAAVAGATWTPGGLFSFVGGANAEFVLAGWHAFAGAQIEDFLLLAGWHGFGRPGSYTLHTFELAIEWGFD